MGDLARCATDGSDAAITVTSDPSNDDMWRITSTGCPNWDWSGNKTPGYAGVQSYELQVPKQPIINSTPTMLNNVNNNIKGMVGIAKNGLAMFNGLDAEDRNAYEYEGLTFDQCGVRIGTHVQLFADQRSPFQPPLHSLTRLLTYSFAHVLVRSRTR